MKGDFTRDTFDSMKHFSRVLMQQGRVTLDADHNEQTAILLHYLRTLARDLIGAYAAPVEHRGFGLSPDTTTGGIIIAAGRYYVDGILVENHQDCPYSAQPDYRVLATEDALLKEINAQSHSDTVFWLYLDVWERHITQIEDDSIREKALDGPDTCTRARVTWQVKALPVEDALEKRKAALEARLEATPPPTEAEKEKIQKNIDAIELVLPKLSEPPFEIDDLPNHVLCETPLSLLSDGEKARLAARVDPGKKIEDPCVMPPDAKYRGAENQLYRVEIHDGGNGATASFKWSRDNGSVATAWLGLGSSGNDLRVSHRRGFEAGNWVELSNDTLDLVGLPGVLVKLTKVEGDALSVDSGTLPPSGIPWSHQLIKPKVRRWDQSANQSTVLKQGAVPIKEGIWIGLEDGIQIKFNSNGDYRTGDYWLIPARVATGGIEWPAIDAVPSARRADGIEHHYAPLGFAWWKNNNLNLRNCGCEFAPLSSCFQKGRERPTTPPRPGGRRRRGGPG